MEIKVGCCGFPVKKEKYFKIFQLVELQSTFYQIPEKIETVKKWREEAPNNFEFTLKAFQVITHPISSPTYKRLKVKFGNPKNYGFFKNKKEVFLAWEMTKKVAEVLNAKLIVFQCPASFKPKKENIQNLRKFFKKIKTKEFIFAWEPRGKWDEKLVKEICKELNLVHCVDPFNRRSVWGEINYFRLHGKPIFNLRYRYTKNDFEELLKFCDKKENYVLFNNLSMFEDAKKFQELIQ